MPSHLSAPTRSSAGRDAGWLHAATTRPSGGCQQPLYWLVVLWLLWSGLNAGPSLTFADEPTTQGNEFFEKRVRPVLVEHCLDCHGEDLSESDLR